MSILLLFPTGPVVAGATLPEDEVVGAEDLAIGATSHRVHGAWLEIDEDCLNFPCIGEVHDKITLCDVLTLGTYFPPEALL